MPGINSDTIRASTGRDRTTLIQNRLDMSASSGLDSVPEISRGSSAIPQIGQEPGSERTISGCIGQVYSVPAFGAEIVVGSRAIPHLGQLPGPACLTSGCIGQVYSADELPRARFSCGSSLEFRYFRGSTLNFAAHPWLQK